MSVSGVWRVCLALVAGLSFSCGGAEEGPANAGAAGAEPESLGSGASAVFFHGVTAAACGNQPCGLAEAAPYAYNPNLYTVSPGNVWHPSFSTWRNYSSVGGYSAGRLPMMDYLAARGAAVDYLFVLDPSYDDGVNYSAAIRGWLQGSWRRRMVMIVGTASDPGTVQQFVRNIRGTPQWDQVALMTTSQDHLAMRQHIPAIANPGYRPAVAAVYEGGLTCGNGCTQCILSNRMDIVKNYRDWGWDVSCGNRDAVASDWYKIDPAGSADVKTLQCPSACTCGNACTMCVLRNRTDIVPFYAKNGWNTACGNRNAIVSNWCGIDPSGCATVKARCGSVCP